VCFSRYASVAALSKQALSFLKTGGTLMSTDLAACIAIIQDDRVLLTKRRDVEVWVLPGGRVEAQETIVEAAVREAREETGLGIQLTRLVGIYTIPEWLAGTNHTVVFAATPAGGVLSPQESEVLELGYFASDALPEPLAWWHRQRINDALGGVGGSAVWTQCIPWPFEQPITREHLYTQIEQSGLPKQDFYSKYFSKPDSEQEHREIPETDSWTRL
jgi:8-oxo-dGTP pyrophosphatase MutT (NUDIX family)